MAQFDIETVFGPSIEYDGPTGIMPFFEHSNGSTYAFNIPSYFNMEPLIPSYSYQKVGNAYSAGLLIDDLRLGNMRDWAKLGTSEDGKNQYVIVDHGLELGASYADWPHGHIYLATETIDGFEFSQVTQHKAFYHSVTTGDVSGDGRPDIIASHMGSNFGAPADNVNIFVQQSDRSFVENSALEPAVNGERGSGAVYVADLDGGGDAEIIEVAYGTTFNGVYAVKIYSGNTEDGFELTTRVLPSGLFDTMGATRIRDIDFDRDGDKDFIISHEGTITPEEEGYTGNGLDILEYTQDGEYKFVSGNLLEKNAWYFSDLQFREFEIVDIDFDGWQDIVLHGWAGDMFFNSHDTFDLGPAIFRNINGEKFEQLSDIPFSYAFDPNSDGHDRSMARFVGTDVETQTAEFFMSVNSWSGKNAPLSVYVQPEHRNASETLFLKHTDDLVLGMGGDDTFIAEGGGAAVGGDGFDIVQFNAPSSSFKVLIDGSDVQVARHSGNGNEAYSLSEIEQLQFDDPAANFDLSQSMGTGALSEEQLESFIELYIAYFNRAPDAIGLNFWGSAFANGMSLDEIAAEFAPQPETVATYPEGTSNTEFVTTVYNNVLGRGPDQEGLDFWVNGLEEGGLTRDTFILNLLGGVREGNSDRAYLDNKVDIGAYFAVHKGMSDATNATAAMALYDGTQNSIDQAVTAIDDYYQAALDPENGEFLVQVVGVLDDPFT